MKERKKRKGSFAVTFTLLVILAVLAYFYINTPRFNVKEFIVEGNKYYNYDEIMILARGSTGANIFFGTDTTQIKKYLEADSYIESAQVVRKLPDTIVIRIKEFIQAAALPHEGEYVVVNVSGNVIKKTDFLPRVTLINGLTVKNVEEREKIEVHEPLLLQQCMEILAQADKNDMFFKSINVSTENFECSIFDGLVCVGTPENIVDSVAKGQLQSVVRRLMDEKKVTGRLLVSGGDMISYSP